MCVLLFDVFKHLLLRKTDVLKTYPKREFLGKKYKVWSGKRLLWHYYFQLSFVYKTDFF